MDLQPTNVLASKILANMLLATGILHTAKLGLYTNFLALDSSTQLSDLHEPTYTGYAQLAITWAGPLIPPEGSWAVEGGLALFQMSDALTPTTVVGFFVTDGAMTPSLLWAQQLDAPIFLTDPAQAVQIAPELMVIMTPTWGEGTVVV